MSCSFRSLKKNNLEAEFCSHLTANKNAESVHSKNRKKNIAWSGGKGWGCNNTPTSKQRDRPHSGDIGMDKKNKKNNFIVLENVCPDHPG